MSQNHSEVFPAALNPGLLSSIQNWPNKKYFMPNPSLPTETLQLMFSHLPTNSYIKPHELIDAAQLVRLISVLPKHVILYLEPNFSIMHQSTLHNYLSNRIRIFLNGDYPPEFLGLLPSHGEFLLGIESRLNPKKIIPYLPAYSTLVLSQNISPFGISSTFCCLRPDQRLLIPKNHDLPSSELVIVPQLGHFSSNTSSVAYSSELTLAETPKFAAEADSDSDSDVTVLAEIVDSEPEIAYQEPDFVAETQIEQASHMNIFNDLRTKKFMAETLTTLPHHQTNLSEIPGLQLNPNKIGKANSLIISIASALMIDISNLKQSIIAYVQQQFVHYINLFGALDFNRFQKALIENVAEDLETIHVLVRFLQRDIVVLSSQSIRMYEYIDRLNVQGAPIYLMLDCFDTFHPYTISPMQASENIQEVVVNRYANLSILRFQIN